MKNCRKELPDFEDYSMKGRTYRYLETQAQYSFDYGLTYGRVKVREAHIEKDDPYGFCFMPDAASLTQ